MDNLASVRNGILVVSGRALYEYLGSDNPYDKWIDNLIKYGDYVENLDYKVETEDTGEVDHVLNINMATEICLLVRTPQGATARQFLRSASYVTL